MFRLVSGEEIIGKVITQTETELSVKEPLVFRIFADKGGAPQLSFQPYVHCAFGKKAEQEIKSFKTAHCMDIDDANDEIVGFYQQYTGSIITPPTGLIGI